MAGRGDLGRQETYLRRPEVTGLGVDLQGRLLLDPQRIGGLGEG